jgi:hypothetical protein
MDFSALTFDQIAMAAMTVIAIREVLIVVLPNRIAGPGGSFINTAFDSRA